MVHQALPRITFSISVAGWDNHKRKVRDQGKLNRGLAVLEFNAVCDATAVASFLARETYSGRELKIAQGLASSTQPLVVAEAKEQKVSQDIKRLYARGNKRRRKQRSIEELEVLMNLLLLQDKAESSLDEAIEALYSNWSDHDAAMQLAAVDWATLPRALDPLGQNKRGGSQRGERKRHQVQVLPSELHSSDFLPCVH